MPAMTPGVALAVVHEDELVLGENVRLSGERRRVLGCRHALDAVTGRAGLGNRRRLDGWRSGRIGLACRRRCRRDMDEVGAIAISI